MARTPSKGQLPLPANAASLQTPAASVLRFFGGESAALSRVKHYLWDTDSLRTYFDTRNSRVSTGPKR
ncbi:hypothetical protein T492DRAFT_875000 [Pavlovales sp. CCMP2436]|nr:hypothetical protein T492DRAFT_875000 [Pavlovales sp. CCMP2436]